MKPCVSPALLWTMGTAQSKFNKANFRRGIRGYRQMFASLHLEQKELKKLWIEFGKIDTDNGGTVGAVWWRDVASATLGHNFIHITREVQLRMIGVCCC